MKLPDIDGLSGGDLLEGMLTGQNPLDFIPLNESADKISGRRVVSCITYRCKDKTVTVWVGILLKNLEPGNWFELHIQYMPRIWTPPPRSNGNRG